jgi:16S rRNA (cytosine1402-N4)-methyltransferase
VSHRAVFVEEGVDALAVRPDGVYVDGTFGRGGHSALILARLGSKGRLIAVDRDPQAVAEGKTWQDPRFSIAHARFAEIPKVLAEQRIEQVDGLLLDLGVSSPQLDQAQRGFSFRQDGPLDMRMDPTQGMSVAQWLQMASQEQIAEVLKNYGEERAAVPIAKAIIARRDNTDGSGRSAFATTGELADLVAGVIRRVSRGKGDRASLGKDPATRSFQALRIFINQELEELASVLDASLQWVRPQGRIAIISFHSLEDRIVKQFFAKHAGKSQWSDAPSLRDKQRWQMAGLAAAQESLGQNSRLEVLKKQMTSDQECKSNPRARSAILRTAIRTEAPFLKEVS